jgi:predicted dehydrogenase
MSTIINWGIIAPGKIARKFASDMRLVEGANLYAVASRDMDRAEDFASEFNADRFFDSYLDLVEDPNVDVIYIASPHSFHFEHSMLCLQNDKHVLCEKPMGMSAQQVERLAKVAAERNLFLMEALWTKFIPSFRECHRLVYGGHIGDVRYIQANFCFKAEYDVTKRLFNKNLGGGSLLDIGIYPVFFALDMAGKPEGILASAVIGKTGVDETCSIIFSYNDKGISANLSSSLLVNTPTEALIAGSKGYIRMHNKWHEPTSFDVVIDGEKQHYSFDEPGFGYQYEIQEVVNCLNRGDRQSVEFPLAKSLRLHETLDSIRQQIGLEY